jgi:hypothetical protein
MSVLERRLKAERREHAGMQRGARANSLFITWTSITSHSCDRLSGLVERRRGTSQNGISAFVLAGAGLEQRLDPGLLRHLLVIDVEEELFRGSTRLSTLVRRGIRVVVLCVVVVGIQFLVGDILLLVVVLALARLLVLGKLLSGDVVVFLWKRLLIWRVREKDGRSVADFDSIDKSQEKYALLVEKWHT